jgi:hypothetical protein
MSDRVRTSVLFSVLALLAACGGGGGGAATGKCPEGMSSAQPCAGKADPACPGAPLAAMCLGGQWGQCMCGGTGTMTGGQTMSGAPTAPAVAVCGDGKAEGGEQCDGQDFKGMTCATLGMGNASAQLVCKQDRCVIDTIMCFSGGMMASGAGTGAGGTGARMMGAAGAGGSGR